ncbi:MAG: hypothetical protein JWM33_268 [Caulobacteraceae bacterium]|nr:hypothetical protein [Caulobacteraceae bacterium]
MRLASRALKLRFAARAIGAYTHRMQFFTRAWVQGDVSDEESDKVVERYQAYIDSLDHQGPVWRFATSLSLHDAYIDHFEVSDDALSLRLLTGDNQRGYWRTLIRYGGGRVVRGQAALDRALADRPTEILYDEFSAAPPGMVHRFLLMKARMRRGEVHIEFDDFAFSETPAAGRVLDET